MLNSRHFASAVTSEEILRGMMFTYVLHRENTFNQIIYTPILSSTAFRLVAEQCDSVQKTFLISRYFYRKWSLRLWRNANLFLKYSEIFFFLPGDDV